MHDRLKPLAGITLFILLLALSAGLGPGTSEDRGISKLTYSMITPGMTEREVERMAGFAGERGIEFRPEGSGRYERRYGMYGLPGVYAAVEYGGGIVRVKRYAEDSWLENRRLPGELFSRIVPGMTRSEVDRLMGYPGEVLSRFELADSTYLTTEYFLSDPPDELAFVQYRNDRVEVTYRGGSSSAATDEKSALRRELAKRDPGATPVPDIAFGLPPPLRRAE